VNFVEDFFRNILGTLTASFHAAPCSERSLPPRTQHLSPDSLTVEMTNYGVKSFLRN